MTRAEPFETNLNGPILMIQLWLQWYIPEFWAANLEFLEGVVPARILAATHPIDHSMFACFYFFQSLQDLGKLGVKSVRSYEVSLVI
ncbi:hypothetical protein ACFX15_039641 [Malus domestica]